MKKNISINISGVIFHIEEDGYERLKDYLESITKYFLAFDDSGEIVADIESRIAEIFLSKLKEGKQVVTAGDVDSLITTMGSIQDFQAVEDEGPQEEEPVAAQVSGKQAGETSSASSQGSTRTEAASKKLYRDGKRRILGGVASGIAHYFSIDPLWIRLLFILLAADVFFSMSLGSIIVITYIVLWIVIPTSDTLKEDKAMKKMYRNPDDHVLGGVCSGLAAYFGADPTVIRFLFALVTVFTIGTGIIVYLVLWIILPEATSITDKVQMQGEPVTLENIESNIKKSLKVEESGEESTLMKVLLFPFRLIAMVIAGLGKVLGPILLFIVEAIRILFGLALVLFGISGIFALLVMMGVILGFVTGGGYWEGWVDFPIHLVSETFPAWGVVLAFLASVIPCLAITLLGLSIIAKTKVINAPVGWMMFGLWMVSLIGLSFLIPRIVYGFRAEADHEETINYNIRAESIHLGINEVGMDDFDMTELTLRGYDGDGLRLVKEFRSFGSSRKDAIENAKSLLYNVELRDSTMTFDSNFRFADDSKFRFQELDMTLYIPYGQIFTLSDGMRNILKHYTMSRHGYYFYQMEGNTWVFNPSGLECLSCFDKEEVGQERSKRLRRSYEESFNVRGYYEEFDLVGFDNIDITGVFEVQLIQSDNYRIVANGKKQYIEDMEVDQEENQLKINYKDEGLLHYSRYRDQVKLIISVPQLRSLSLNGATRGYIKGFDVDRLKIDLNGASEAEADLDAYEIEIELSGASRLTLAGTGHEMTADLSAASVLDAYDYRVDDATIDASIASSAKVYVRENLEINASLASDIKYRGGARVRDSRRKRRHE